MQTEVGNLTIGILSLQGGFLEHENHIKKLGYNTILVKIPKDLENIDGLIIPGGESTAISNLLKISKLDEDIKRRGKDGLPIWGTCAGMILLSKKVENDDISTLSLLDIEVKRNAYGRQLDSFNKDMLISKVNKTNVIPLVFIRAPYVNRILSDEVEIIAEIDNNIVAVRQGNILATSFHPELTTDLNFHKYFADICYEHKITSIRYL